MCNATGHKILDTELRLVHSISSLVISTVGTLGNTLSVILICNAQLYRTAPTMMLIVELCFTNLITATLILPGIAVNNFQNHWLFGETICQAFGYTMYVTITTECLLLMNITISQYLVIVHRMSNNTLLHNHQARNLFLLLGLPWLFSIAAFLIPLTQTWDKFGYDPRRGYCTLLDLQDGLRFQTMICIVLFLAMSGVIFYCYPAIFCVHLKSRRKTNSSVMEAAARFRGRARNAQLVKMIIVILANFALTYLPFLMLSIVDPCLQTTPLAVYTVVLYVSWSHVATNPIIYALMNTKLNALWRDLLPCLRTQTRLTEKSLVEVVGQIRSRTSEIKE